MALQIRPDSDRLDGNLGVLGALEDAFDPNLTFGNVWFFVLLFVLIQMIWLQHE